MKSLESQKSSLRTLETFYQFKNRPKNTSSKKVFPHLMKNQEFQTLYQPNTKQLSTRKYIDLLARNKSLQRRPMHKNQFYEFIKFNNYQNEESQSYVSGNNSFRKRQRSLESIKLSTIASRTESTLSILSSKRRHSLFNQLTQFKSRVQSQEKQQLDKLRFTFYNSSKEKTKYFMQKYNKDESLEERSKSTYQNAFNRTIATQNLMKTLYQINKKRRKGENA